jgi:hypothetical protein
MVFSEALSIEPAQDDVSMARDITRAEAAQIVTTERFEEPRILRQPPVQPLHVALQ